jgi:hypothetical protein
VGDTLGSTLLRFHGAFSPGPWRHVWLAPLTPARVDAKDVWKESPAEFSTIVESDRQFVADRAMTWDSTGYGSHSETSVASPASTWYFAEGTTQGDFNLFYLVLNPNDDAVSMQVTYLLPAPRAPIVRSYPVDANARLTIWVDTQDAALQNAEVAAVVTADRPIIVERAQYLDAPGRMFSAGHESAGVTAPSTEWFLAEGAIGDFFDLFVLVANATGTDARVTAQFLLPGGESRTKDYLIPAQSRFNIYVDDQLDELRDTAVSIVITSTNGVPVVVERAMWWPGPTAATWAEAHNAAGLTTTGRTWAIAAGEAGGPRQVETYILIANRGADDAARVTIHYEDGTTEAITCALPATSRTNVSVGVEFPQSRGRRFAAIVEAQGPDPQIAVEYATYSSAAGVPYAAGSSALATRIR